MTRPADAPDAQSGARRFAPLSRFSDLTRSLRLRLRWRAKRRALIRAGRPVTLFLAPEAGLKPYYASHLILAKTLLESGHGALILSCDGIQPICSWKFASSVFQTAPGDRANRACASCREARGQAEATYNVPLVFLEELVDAGRLERIRQLITANRGKLDSVEVDGVAVGVLALAEALRFNRKLDYASFNEEDQRLTEAILFSTLVVYHAVTALIATGRIGRTAFFGDYAYWIAAQILAKKHGIAAVRVNHTYNRDFDRRVIGLHPESANTHLLDQHTDWPRFRELAIAPEMIATIAESALYRLRSHGGTSTYSPNWARVDDSFREQLGLRRDRKTIVAYVSSTDEIVASRAILAAMGRSHAGGPRPFEDQTAWLRDTVEWVSTRPDHQLVVRLHPRMGRSVRSQSQAAEFDAFRRELSRLPDNAIVVWPDDPTSSYNLAEIADAAVVAWSTMALELGRMGVPVLAAFDGIGSFPTGGFVGYETAAARHFGALERAAQAPADLARIREAFRWTYYAFWAPGVDVSDLIPTPDYEEIPTWHSPKNRHAITRVLGEGEDMTALNMRDLPQTAVRREAEEEALIRSLSQFVWFFVTGESRISTPSDRIATRQNAIVELDWPGGRALRSSPLAHRLGELLVRHAHARGTAEAAAKV